VKILIIDDEACVARALQRAMKEHDVVVATDPATVSELVASVALTDPFELVLCDVRMPGMTGIDVLRALWRHRERPIFVLMSGDDALIDTETGADAILLKPFTANDFRVVIARIREVRATARTARIRCLAAA